MAKRLDRRHWRAGSVTTQVDEQLAVGKALPALVTPVDGQGRLADAGGAGDHAQHDRPRRTGHHGVQRGKFGRPASEVRHRRRELRGDREQRRRPQGGFGPHDGLVSQTDLAPRIHAELLGEGGAEPMEHGESVRLPAGPVERQHELRARPLPQRIGVHQLLQLRQHLRVPAECEFAVDQLLLRGQALVVKPSSRGLDKTGHRAAQRRPPPQQQRGAQCLGCVQVAGAGNSGPRLRHVCPENVQVKRPVIDGELVSARTSGQGGAEASLTQYLSDSEHTAAQLRHGTGRRRRSPDRVCERCQGDHSVRMQQQVGEHRLA